MGEQVERPALRVAHNRGADQRPERVPVPVHQALLEEQGADLSAQQAPQLLLGQRDVVRMREVQD